MNAEVHRTHCCFYCKVCKFPADEVCPVLNKKLAQAKFCETCFKLKLDPRLLELITELEMLAKACESSEEWVKGRTELTFTPSGIYSTHINGELKDQYHEAGVWYDDGDLCARMEDNPALGFWGDNFGKLFAKCSPKNILELCSLIRSATR